MWQVQRTYLVGMSQRYKIVLLGEGRVGKTSILLRYIRGEYSDQQVSTLQASYLDKKITISGTQVHLSVWDTAGCYSGLVSIISDIVRLYRPGEISCFRSNIL